MGSLDNAVMTGFICRLCSEMSRLVIHIYGEEGARLQLAKKINEYLPINVSNIQQANLHLLQTSCPTQPDPSY